MRRLLVRAGLTAASVLLLTPGAAQTSTACVTAHDYPTAARVEYVQECVYRHGGESAFLYKCACALDRIAETLSYDDFIEASTYVRYAGFGGEAAGLFRETDRARQMARRFREVQGKAFAACGLPPEA